MRPSRPFPPSPSLLLSHVPASDLYPTLLSSLCATFSSSWSLLTAHPHLHNVFPSIPSSPLSPLSTRFLDVLRSSILLGHTRFSHGHLMRKEPPQPCPYCAAPPPISINHVLFQCPSLTTLRQTYLASLPVTNPYATLASLLRFSPSTFPPIVTFLSACNLLHRI